MDAEMAQGRAILAAADEARVPHLVFSSVASADQRSGVPHFDSKARIETELAAGHVPYPILGPTYIFDNALGGADRIRGGVLDVPLPADRPLQQLARADLGAFASQVLLGPAPYVGHRIESSPFCPKSSAVNLRGPAATTATPTQYAYQAIHSGDTRDRLARPPELRVPVADHTPPHRVRTIS
ncbi:hypothetical protein GCM10027605_28310 [Micromonospora zhanjiangensis]